MTDPAQVVNCKPGRDWPNKHLVSKTVGELAALVADTEGSVSMTFSSRPEPTGSSLVNLRPKTLFGGKIRGHHEPRFHGVCAPGLTTSWARILYQRT